jgi:hypothetical protein
MPSRALSRFLERISEVETLLDIHREKGGEDRGRREDRLKVLHKSAIVLLAACLENYCESVIQEAAQLLADKTTDPDKLPTMLKKNIALQQGIRDRDKNKDDLRPWDFAGEGWREILTQCVNARTLLLNTPDSERIQSLFLNLLGIEDITESWARQKKNRDGARNTLDELMERRHEIAHGALMESAPLKTDVERFRGFLSRTVSQTDQRVGRLLESVTGTEIW